jgi:hypothetical protein
MLSGFLPPHDSLHPAMAEAHHWETASSPTPRNEHSHPLCFLFNLCGVVPNVSRAATVNGLMAWSIVQ